MKITDLNVASLEIPFNIAFSHASASRKSTQSIIVAATTQTNIGYGEACPRVYVTGETLSSATMFFHKHQCSLIKTISDLSSLKIWANDHQDEIDANPAAWCAIELALLDLFAKETGSSVERLLGLPELTADFNYTAVLGDSGIEGFLQLLERYDAMGFFDYKVKLSGNLERDKQKCHAIMERLKDARLRFDANNLWETSTEAVNYVLGLGLSVFALEEPLKANQYSELTEIANHLHTQIILDESFLRLEHFNYIQDSPDKWLINVRVSKMGGLLRSLAILEKAKALGIKCIVGAQVGEVSILTRSALTLVNAYRDVVIAQEGGCGTYLLKNDICSPVLMFADGGRIGKKQLSQLGQFGFGLDVCLP